LATVANIKAAIAAMPEGKRIVSASSSNPSALSKASHVGLWKRPY